MMVYLPEVDLLLEMERITQFKNNKKEVMKRVLIALIMIFAFASAEAQMYWNLKDAHPDSVPTPASGRYIFHLHNDAVYMKASDGSSTKALQLPDDADSVQITSTYKLNIGSPDDTTGKLNVNGDITAVNGRFSGYAVTDSFLATPKINLTSSTTDRDSCGQRCSEWGIQYYSEAADAFTSHDTFFTLIDAIPIDTSHWDKADTNLYWNNGNVGIGTAVPEYQLHLTERMRGTQFSFGTDLKAKDFHLLGDACFRYNTLAIDGDYLHNHFEIGDTLLDGYGGIYPGISMHSTDTTTGVQAFWFTGDVTNLAGGVFGEMATGGGVHNIKTLGDNYAETLYQYDTKTVGHYAKATGIDQIRLDIDPFNGLQFRTLSDLFFNNNLFEVDTTGRVRLHNFTGANPSGSEGQLIYNADSSALFIYAGGSWQKLN